MRWGVWQEIDHIYQEYHDLLQELTRQKNITLEPIIKTSFLNVSSPLPYLGDRALANRQLTNCVAEIFLDNNQNKIPANLGLVFRDFTKEIDIRKGVKISEKGWGWGSPHLFSAVRKNR